MDRERFLCCTEAWNHYLGTRNSGQCSLRSFTRRIRLQLFVMRYIQLFISKYADLFTRKGATLDSLLGVLKG